MLQFELIGRAKNFSLVLSLVFSLVLLSKQHILFGCHISLPFENYHLLPMFSIDCIDIPTGLHTEARTWTTCRKSFNCWNINELARVELESRFCAMHLKVYIRIWVIKRCKFLQAC